MQILISNDDGIEAPGIEAMVELAREFGEPIVFAPANQQSGIGHQVTVDGPISIRQQGENRYAVAGTPADCIRVAMSQFDFDFQWMLSGINAGGNLGVDVYMSGTAAAAREASYYGIASIAVSQYRGKGDVPDWNRSGLLAKRAIEFALAKKDAGEGFWNINLPCLNSVSNGGQEVPIRVCKLDRNPHKIAYRKSDNSLYYDGVYQDRPRDHSSDVDLCFGGAVTLTRCS